MAPLAKPMAPPPLTMSRQDGSSAIFLARSSSLESTAISEAIRVEGPGSRRDGVPGGQSAQVRASLLFSIHQSC